MAKDTFHARPDAGKTFTVAMWLLGMAAAALQSVFGFGDLGTVQHLALVELLIAAGAFLLSAASLAGMFRRAPDEPVDPATAEEQSVAS